ncbi:MAG: DMT family transporter [Bacteroidia bacterium]|nr:DMT family transporter [Bacteroidia bacterium]
MGSNRSLKFFLFTILCLIWGSSFILMKRGLDAFTPAQVAAIRMTVAFLCLLPFVIGHIRLVPRHKWKYIILAGALGNGIPAVLFTTAETRVPSSVAGMLNSLTPVFTLIVGILFYRYRPGLIRTAGIFLGLAGASLIVLHSGQDGIGNQKIYSFYILLACILYSIDTYILNFNLADLKSIDIAGFALIPVGLVAGCYLFSTDFTWRLAHTPGAAKSLAAAGLLGALGTATAQALFNKMLKISSPLFASSVTYCIPFVALLWGMLDHEKISALHIAGFTITLAGIALVNRRMGEP